MLKISVRTLIIASSSLFIGLISACNSFDPSQTTFIIDYPPPRLTNIYLNGTQLNGEIAITLNPSINNDLREYWLVLANADQEANLPQSIGGTNDVYDLEATPEESLQDFFAILPDVTNFFSSTTVNNYIFNDLELPTNSPKDSFYKIGARAWGSNDSFAIANQHNGWIISTLSETLTFYVGYETNLCFTPGTNQSVGVGYSHIASTTNSNPNPTTVSPCDASSYNTQDSTYLQVEALTSQPPPEIIFYTDPLISTNTRISVSEADVVLFPSALENLGEIIDLSAFGTANGITSAQPTGFPVRQDSIFLIQHGNGNFSKIQVESLTDTNIQIRAIYTGTNGTNLNQF